MLESNPSFYRGLVKKYTTLIDDISRLSEVMFGVIMVLTFTCAMNISDQQEVNATLWAALGCNTAWGIVDGLFFLMNTLYERGDKIQILRKIQMADTAPQAVEAFRDNMPSLITDVMSDAQVGEICTQLQRLPLAPERAFFTTQDFLNMVVVFLLVFFSTFPIVLPFVFIDNATLALRTSNGVGLIIMFIAGFKIAKRSGYQPMLMGILFALLGAAIVSFTMALGG